VDAFTESLRLDAGQYDVLCNLGVALNARNDPADAEQTFREASLLQPDNPRLQAFIGIVEVRNQKWEDAKRNLARALQRSPDNPHLQNALALAELHSGSTDQALKRLESITKKNPAYAPALFNIASIHLDWLKNPVEAKKWLELYLSKSSDRDPFSALARSRLETIASEGRIPFTARENPDRKAAEKSFLNALKAHQEGDLDNAIKWYIRAIEEDSTYEQAFYNLGLVYYTQGKMELAGEAFAKAVQLNPAFIAARYNSALVNYRLGNNDRALRELELILTQQPDYQPAVDLIARIRK
jgi:tetratricopeptide (TPR) repeat protein